MIRGQVQRRGNRWRAIVQIPRPDGTRQTISVTTATEAEAQQERVKLLAKANQLAAGHENDTVNDLLTAWLLVVEQDWTAATRDAHRHYIENYIRPRLGATKVRKLRRADVDAFYADVRRQGVSGRPLSAASVRRLHNVRRRALEQAVRWEWIADNPAHGATLPKLPPPRITPPTPEVLVELLENANRLDPEMGLFFVLASATGARRGELCALQWHDIDFSGGRITIRRALSGAQMEVGPPKAHRIRSISVDPLTMGLLEEQRVVRERLVASADGELSAGSFVFARDVAGAIPWRPNSATRRWRKLLAATGHENVRLHDLRHFVATRLLSSGVDVRTVAHRLGHGSGGRVTLQRYAHFVAGTDRAAANFMGDLIRRPTAYTNHDEP